MKPISADKARWAPLLLLVAVLGGGGAQTVEVCDLENIVQQGKLIYPYSFELMPVAISSCLCICTWEQGESDCPLQSHFAKYPTDKQHDSNNKYDTRAGMHVFAAY